MYDYQECADAARSAAWNRPLGQFQNSYTRPGEMRCNHFFWCRETKLTVHLGFILRTAESETFSRNANGVRAIQDSPAFAPTPLALGLNVKCLIRGRAKYTCLVRFKDDFLHRSSGPDVYSNRVVLRGSDCTAGCYRQWSSDSNDVLT